jgi:hypothetical protein
MANATTRFPINVLATFPLNTTLAVPGVAGFVVVSLCSAPTTFIFEDGGMHGGGQKISVIEPEDDALTAVPEPPVCAVPGKVTVPEKVQLPKGPLLHVEPPLTLTPTLELAATVPLALPEKPLVPVGAPNTTATFPLLVSVNPVLALQLPLVTFWVM